MNRNSQEKPSRSLAASHQRSWLWGRHAVTETLTAGLWPVAELLVDEQVSAAIINHLESLTSRKNLQIQRVSSRRLTELCHAEDHQGLLARMGEFPFRTHQDLCLRLREKATEPSGKPSLPPLFVVCDRIQDSHNFGAILRCCDAIHADGVVIGERSQVSVTPHVARASSGAVNHLNLYRVANLANALRDMKTDGLKLLAASEKSTQQLWQVDAKGAVAVVIGSEATGIAPELLAECDVQLAIPMFGGVGSLNAAVAAGIVLYECRRQQLVAT